MVKQLWNKHPLISQIVFMGALLLVLFELGMLYPSTKLGFLLVVALAVVNPKARSFAIDFAPFIVLLLTYNTLRSFADNLGASDIHITDLIDLEKRLFGGTLPGHYLQTHLWDHWYTPVVDVLANTFYLSHFITPVIAAAFLWRHKKTEYWAFAFGLVALSFAAFATFVVLPAAPPWWATYHGYLPTEPISLDHFIVNAEMVNSSPNPVAAMPSLHVGYPTYIALVCMAVWGRKAWFVWLLPLGVASSAVYLGHHYVIDALAGAGYGFVTFATVYFWLRRHTITVDVIGKLKSVAAIR